MINKNNTKINLLTNDSPAFENTIKRCLPNLDDKEVRKIISKQKDLTIEGKTLFTKGKDDEEIKIFSNKEMYLLVKVCVILDKVG